MSVSGGAHDDFLKLFRKSPALRGVAFKCPMYGSSVKVPALRF